jgi:hypothetical protein
MLTVGHQQKVFRSTDHQIADEIQKAKDDQQ